MTQTLEQPLFHGSMESATRLIYTPSSFAKANLIHLQETGRLKALKPHKNSRKGLSSYLFFLVLEGEGALDFEGKHYALSKGDCAFIDCHKAYSHATANPLWSLQWVHFYGPNLGAIYEKYVQRGGLPCFTPDGPARYEVLLTQIYEIAVSPSYLKDMQLFEKLTSLLTFLMEESWHPEHSGQEGTGKRNLQDVKEYLDDHFQDKISLDVLAELFYINKFYLSRCFKEQFGLTINSYLTQVRITHAKQLLRFTDQSIEEIGNLCGIGDPNYFARLFRQIEGLSPGEFRRSW